MYDELKYRELIKQANVERDKMLLARNEFVEAYKKFYNHMSSCVDMIEKIREEIITIKGF